MIPEHAGNTTEGTVLWCRNRCLECECELRQDHTARMCCQCEVDVLAERDIAGASMSHGTLARSRPCCPPSGPTTSAAAGGDPYG